MKSVAIVVWLGTLMLVLAAGAALTVLKEGNDTPVGGPGEHRIFTGPDFDFVFAIDGDRDVVDCNGQTRYRIVFEENPDRLERCPGANIDAKATAAALASVEGRRRR
jgi:hypothetical protein